MCTGEDKKLKPQLIYVMQNTVYREKDDEFIAEYQERLIEFMRSDETVLVLEPMNSYYRRLVHHLALEFQLQTKSKGEEKDRHVVLAKGDKSAVPEKIKNKKPVVWNFGDQEFIVDPLQESVEVFLGKDGTVGLYDENSDIPYITKKKVVSGAFKVKMNKIVELHDDEW